MAVSRAVGTHVSLGGTKDVGGSVGALTCYSVSVFRILYVQLALSGAVLFCGN